MNAVRPGRSRTATTPAGVRENRRDEVGDLAAHVQPHGGRAGGPSELRRKELVANVSHELRTPIAGLRAVLENLVDGVTEADPETMRTALGQTGAARPAGGDAPRPLPPGQRRRRRCSKRRFEVLAVPVRGVLKEANLVGAPRAAGIASSSGSHTRTDVHLAPGRLRRRS